VLTENIKIKIKNEIAKCLNRKQKLFFKAIKGFKNIFVLQSKIIAGK